MAHLFGLGLDCSDGHKRLTQAEKFSIMGGSEETHDKMTETLCKTFEDLSQKGKTLEEASMEELNDLIKKNSLTKDRLELLPCHSSKFSIRFSLP